MATMPGVHLEDVVESHAAVVGVNQFSCEGFIGGEFKEDCPAVMQVLDDGEGMRNGERRVGEIGPGVFIIGFHGGLVFSEAEANTDKRVHVRVGDVVHQLPDGPAASAVWLVDVVFAESDQGLL